jgi:hypothetical protein
MQYLKGAEVQVLGYTFGYRHQFALLTANYAKLQMVMGLARPLITLSFPYLSWTYGVLRRLKIRRPLRSWGFDPPSRHQQNKELRLNWPLGIGEAKIVWWLF